MKGNFKIQAVLSCFLFSMASGSWGKSFENSSWELINEEGGVRVFRLLDKKIDLLTVKVEGILEAPPEKVLWATNDIDHLYEWVVGLESVNVMKRLSENSLILYNHFHFPFPFRDRDAVIQVNFTFNPKNLSVRMQSYSVEYPGSPDTVGIRAKLVQSDTLIEPIKGGKATKMTSITQIDLKGWIPKWLIGFLQKRYAAQSIILLRQQVKKEHVKQYPSFSTTPYVRFRDFEKLESGIK